MPFSVFAVLLSWIPIGVFLFHRFPVRVAILANFFAGWALLPGAAYAPSNNQFPYWILGVCLPSTYFLTKATVIGVTGLLGILISDAFSLRKFHLSLFDLPILLWCCAPLLSTAANGGGLMGGLRAFSYQVLAWGVPYLLGRVYFSDNESMLLAAKACVLAGLCYVPICLFEFFFGPQLYAFFYGYEPYRWTGAERYIGFRPVGFLEDGNQLGIWMAAAALTSVCLWARRLSTRILRLPGAFVAGVLGATTILCQSVGSIILFLILIPLGLIRRRVILQVVVSVLILITIFFASFRMFNVVSLRSLAKENHTIHSVVVDLSRLGRQSFAWRLARDESDVSIALQSPVFGSGQWNWWQKGELRPWGLWILVLGMYGLTGLVAVGLLQLLPLIRIIWLASGERTETTQLRLILAGIILMTAVDNLFNGAMILPYLLIIGALSSPARYHLSQSSSLTTPPTALDDQFPNTDQ